MKSVLIVSAAADVGGAEIILANLVAQLKKGTEFEFDLVCSKAESLSQFFRVPARRNLFRRIIEVEVPVASQGSLLSALVGMLRTNFQSLAWLRYDLILYNNPQALFYFGIFPRFLPGRRSRILFNHNSFLPNSHIKLLKYGCRVDATVHVSEAAKRYFESFEPGLASYRIYNSVPDSADQDVSAPSGMIRFCSISRITPGKGLHVLIDAFAIYQKHNPGTEGAVLDIYGTPAKGDEGYLDELQRKVAAYGLEQLVSFRGHANPYRALERASCLVVPSTIPDSLPTVIIEAFASRRLVIGSDVGGIPELVQEGRTGLLVAPNDARALARAMHSAATMCRDGRAMSLTALAREFFDATLSQSAQFRNWLHILKALVA
jgi:glycosyltransferase involved in cell wall biosynthesis